MSTGTPTGPALITSFDELVAALKATGAPVSEPVTDGVATIPLLAPPLDTIVFARWETAPPYMHMLCLLIDGITDDHLPAVESTVTRLNNGIPYPGFGIDYAHRAVYFKITYPTVDGLEAGTLHHLVGTMIGNARDFLIPMHKIIREGAAPETVGELHELWVEVDRTARGFTRVP